MKRTNNILLKIELKDSDVKNIIDSSNSKKLKSIKVKIEATHSGKINKNFWFYTPKGMQDGADSFVKPYNKPVTVNHDPHADPLGRVLESRYVSYDNYNTPLHNMDFNDSKKLLASVKKWIKTADFKDTTYKGLGHIELIAEITDPEAIQKIIDKRYLTVSIGGGSDMAICSVCGTNKKTNYCDHYRGETYKDEVCFLVSGKMEFDHISYVSSPADLDATSEVIEDSFGTATLEILDYEIDKGSQNMKLTIKQLREKFAKYTDFAEYMNSIGLAKHVSQKLCDEAKEISFLFADERAIPLFDKAHYVAAATFIKENLEDSADKEAILAVIEDQAKSQIGDLSLEDALKELADVTSENITNVDANALGELKVGISDEAVSKLIDSINNSLIDKLKETFSISDSFAAQRMRALQRDNSALSESLSSLEDKYKGLVVSSIVNLIDNKSEEYKAKLLSRNISSLEDQLNDLVDKTSKLEDNVTNADKDSKELETNVTINDANSTSGEKDDKLEDTNKDKDKDTNNSVTQLSVSEVKDTYREKVRTEGLKSAKAWFQQITDEGKVPSNFTFN